MPITLPFAHYCFTFKALDAFVMPEHSGTLWHSVVGNALHTISCMVSKGVCQTCLFKRRCDYPVLFQGIRPINSTLMGNCNTIPTPHIFRVQQPQHYSIEAQQTFSIEIILLGTANKKLAALIQAMQKVGANGFRQKRQKAQLIQVSQKMPDGIDKQISLHTEEAPIALPLHYTVPKHVPQKLQLDFHSPFRPPNTMARETDFHVDRFVMGLIRRISTLQYFYTGKMLEVDYSALKALTRQLPVLQQTMKQQQNPILKERKNQHRQGKTWSGSIAIDLTQKPYQALWPYLYLGQWLQTGKNASMGFGRYQLTDIT